MYGYWLDRALYISRLWSISQNDKVSLLYILLYAYQISPEWSDQNKVVEESRPNAWLVFNHHLMMILYAYQSKGNTNGLVMNM